MLATGLLLEATCKIERRLQGAFVAQRNNTRSATAVLRYT